MAVAIKKEVVPLRYRSATGQFERWHWNYLARECHKCHQEYVLYWRDDMDEWGVRNWFDGYVAINHPHPRDGFSINEQFPDVDVGEPSNLRPGKPLHSGR
jgi:hypothetical protein